MNLPGAEELIPDSRPVIDPVSIIANQGSIGRCIKVFKF
jgi:hypothetical protein